MTGLTPSVTYDIKVQARNVINYGALSSVLSVLAAQIPDAPENLQNVPSDTSANQIGLTWDPPTFDGGSPVIDYRLWYDNGSGS